MTGHAEYMYLVNEKAKHVRFLSNINVSVNTGILIVIVYVSTKETRGMSQKMRLSY